MMTEEVFNPDDRVRAGGFPATVVDDSDPLQVWVRLDGEVIPTPVRRDLVRTVTR